MSPYGEQKDARAAASLCSLRPTPPLCRRALNMTREPGGSPVLGFLRPEPCLPATDPRHHRRALPCFPGSTIVSWLLQWEGMPWVLSWEMIKPGGEKYIYSHLYLCRYICICNK